MRQNPMVSVQNTGLENQSTGNWLVYDLVALGTYASIEAIMWARFRIDAINVDIGVRIESLNVGTQWRMIPRICSDESGHLHLVLR